MADEGTIDIASNDRVAVFGQTGSGKTYLCRYLLKDVRRLVVLDPKGTLGAASAPGWRLTDWSAKGAKLLEDGKPCRLRVPAPLDGDWDAWLWAVYNAGNVVLYVDEMYGVVPIGKRPPIPLNAIYTRGRELGLGVVAVSQRPAWIPREMVSESTWMFAFRLMLLSDRVRLREIMGDAALEPIPDRYGFLTYNAEWSEPVYTEQLVVRKRRSA